MAESNDSIEITPGTGAPVATQLINGKEYQVMIETNANGHLIGDIPTYSVWTGSVATAASRVHLHLFNATGSGKIIKIKKVFIQFHSGAAVAISGVGQTWRFAKTSTAGTGTGLTIRSHDANNPAIPSQITAAHSHTTQPTQSFTYFEMTLNNEETLHVWGTAGYYNLLPTDGDRVTDYVLNPGEGLAVQNVTGSPAYNYSLLAVFSIE